jgi:3-phenylpropionate/cinnamic acid dioxygenase small subunit
LLVPPTDASLRTNIIGDTKNHEKADMSTTTVPDTTTSRQALAELADRQAISDLLHRWGAILDELRLDDLRSVFTADAALTTPGGHAEGIDAILAQAGRNHDPAVRTQHLMGDLVLDLDGDRASARANYVGVFAKGEGRFAPPPVFQIGSVYRLGLVRTAEGWRIRSMEMQPTWAAGERV